jgi:hypothetical protein
MKLVVAVRWRWCWRCCGEGGKGGGRNPHFCRAAGGAVHLRPHPPSSPPPPKERSGKEHPPESSPLPPPPSPPQREPIQNGRGDRPPTPPPSSHTLRPRKPSNQPTNQPTNQPGRQPAARRIPPNHTTPHNLTEIPTQKKHAKRCRTTHPSPRGIHDEINCELPLKPSRPTHFLDVPIESGNALWHCTSMARKSYAEIQQGQRRT